jgi:hypothetical protein
MVRVPNVPNVPIVPDVGKQYIHRRDAEFTENYQFSLIRTAGTSGTTGTAGTR